MTELQGRVAVVTGASRGVGKGIALGLGEAGATVYATGRSLEEPDDPRGSLTRTAAEVAELGGVGIPVRCDHRDDAQVRAVFDRVRTEQGRLDLLVNNVMSTPQRGELPAGALSQWDLHPFWAMPIWVWDAFHTVGLRSHYVASAFAAPLLIGGGGGLIVTISSPALAATSTRRLRGGQGGIESRRSRPRSFHRRRSLGLALAGPHEDRGRPRPARRLSRPQPNGVTALQRSRGRRTAGHPRVIEKTGQRLEGQRARGRVRLHRR